MEHTPTTREGFELWDVLTRYGQFRFYPDGTVAGFDIPQTVKIAKTLGYDSRAALLLMPYAQQGLQEALDKINQKEK